MTIWCSARLLRNRLISFIAVPAAVGLMLLISTPAAYAAAQPDISGSLCSNAVFDIGNNQLQCPDTYSQPAPQSTLLDKAAPIAFAASGIMLGNLVVLMIWTRYITGDKKVLRNRAAQRLLIYATAGFIVCALLYVWAHLHL